MAYPILISGSLAYDQIMEFPGHFAGFLRPDEKGVLSVSFGAHRMRKGLGGGGGNTAYAMRLLGGEPVLVSALGSDGGDYLEFLKAQGIDTRGVMTDSQVPSANATIITDEADGQLSAFYFGPLEKTVDISPGLIGEGVRCALISPMPPTVMVRHMRQCKALELTTIFDPGQQVTLFGKSEIEELISLTDYLICNEYERGIIGQLTGWTVDEFTSHVPTVITTLAERGCEIRVRDGETLSVPACTVAEVVDPTGAGDAFRAGFFTALVRGNDLETCARIGSVSASYPLEVAGTQDYHFTMQEFAARYQTTFDQALNWEKV